MCINLTYVYRKCLRYRAVIEKGMCLLNCLNKYIHFCLISFLIFNQSISLVLECVCYASSRINFSWNPNCLMDESAAEIDPWCLQWQAKHNKRIPTPMRLSDEILNMIFKQKEYIC